MSGLLRRLALQTIDRKSIQVHSIARLPFSGAATIETLPPDADAAGLVVKTPDSVSDLSSVASPRPSADIVGSTPADDGSRTGGRTRRVAQTVSEHNQAPETPKSAQADARPPGPVASAKQNIDTASNATSAHRSADAAASDDVPPVQPGGHSTTPAIPDPEGAGTPGRVAGDPRAGQFVVEHPQPVRHRVGASPPQVPAPLLGPVVPDAAVPAIPSRQGRQTRARSELQAPDVPNEVHVHIGRVEVTAVQEPVPAKPKARAGGKQPMSLDDYLARRDRSRK